MSKRGPLASAIQPSREKYKCPVKDCKSESLRGDDITKHFQKSSDLVALDKTLENQSALKKCGKDDIELSVTYLKNLLALSSESEKLHTLYLLNNGHSSKKLPTYNSVNFKCQLKSLPNALAKFGFSVSQKKQKLSYQSDNSDGISNPNSDNNIQEIANSNPDDNDQILNPTILSN